MRIFSVSLAVTTLVISTLAFTARADDSTTNHDQMAGMTGMSMSSGTAQSSNVTTRDSGTGVIKAWNSDSVSIAHHPIAQLNWPAMTMSFELKNYHGQKFAAGQQVDFTFSQIDTGYALVSASAK